MDLLSVVLIAVALAMDAFSIALSKGLAAKRLKTSDGVKLGATFGAFQALMPFIGWLVGSSFSSLIQNYSHWVGFALLTFIGGKMIYESIKGSDDDEADCSLTFRSLILLGVATSIDALAVGLTFALGNESVFMIIIHCLIIGVITLVISFVGYFLGGKIGKLIGSKGEIIGGIVLIVIGIKMLADKLF